MTPGEVTGEAAGEIRRLAPDVEMLAQRLRAVDYLVDEGLATSMFLSLRPEALRQRLDVGDHPADLAAGLARDLPRAHEAASTAS